ncbi:hypothetical protein [Candidatus Electronema sp. JC]|uniref:hypothetical protein n=1 Tax=Candidatus Electronema sp. JC TaxID=3401570 RepID=UPI003B431255
MQIRVGGINQRGDAADDLLVGFLPDFIIFYIFREPLRHDDMIVDDRLSEIAVELVERQLVDIKEGCGDVRADAADGGNSCLDVVGLRKSLFNFITIKNLLHP